MGRPRLLPSRFQTSQSAPCSSLTGSGSISPIAAAEERPVVAVGAAHRGRRGHRQAAPAAARLRRVVHEHAAAAAHSSGAQKSVAAQRGRSGPAPSRPGASVRRSRGVEDREGRQPVAGGRGRVPAGALPAAATDPDGRRARPGSRGRPARRRRPARPRAARPRYEAGLEALAATADQALLRELDDAGRGRGLADHRGAGVVPVEQLGRGVGVLARDDHAEAAAHVEDLVQLGVVDAAALGDVHEHAAARGAAR